MSAPAFAHPTQPGQQTENIPDRGQDSSTLEESQGAGFGLPLYFHFLHQSGTRTAKYGCVTEVAPTAPATHWLVRMRGVGRSIMAHTQHRPIPVIEACAHPCHTSIGNIPTVLPVLPKGRVHSHPVSATTLQGELGGLAILRSTAPRLRT